MDPNGKLTIEEFARQIQEEIKDGFVAINMHVFESVGVGRQRDLCVSASASIDKPLADRKPEVEASITSVKLELVKLNTYFDCNAKRLHPPQAWYPLHRVGVRASI
jgi:hypothetical protein